LTLKFSCLECQVASHSDEVNYNVHETAFNDVSRITRKSLVNLLISLKKMAVETSKDIEDIATCIYSIISNFKIEDIEKNSS